ncbi:protein translocase SEC61 complex subunit gamma [Methanocella sp. MCL-LM]|uniref:protein translocase SEC61 complex subunit gamma n=1 Tax=Methanocella sp. MCL-LM TaxID=3412035 RepID=UPI003C777346
MAEKATQNQISLENITGGLKQYYRIIQLTRKPSNEEFLTIAKVAGAGILLIGVIGFAIYLLMVQVPKIFG